MRYKILIAISLLAFSINAQARGDSVKNIFNYLILDIAKKLDSDKKNLDDILRETAEEKNKNLPMILDSETRLDTMSTSSGRVIVYAFTLYKIRSTEIDAIGFGNAMREQIRNGVCTDPDMLTLFSNDITISYLYRGSNGGYIAKITINANDCARM